MRDIFDAIQRSAKRIKDAIGDILLTSDSNVTKYNIVIDMLTVSDKINWITSNFNGSYMVDYFHYIPSIKNTVFLLLFYS